MSSSHLSPAEWRVFIVFHTFLFILTFVGIYTTLFTILCFYFQEKILRTLTMLYSYLEEKNMLPWKSPKKAPQEAPKKPPKRSVESQKPIAVRPEAAKELAHTLLPFTDRVSNQIKVDFIKHEDEFELNTSVGGGEDHVLVTEEAQIHFPADSLKQESEIKVTIEKADSKENTKILEDVTKQFENLALFGEIDTSDAQSSDLSDKELNHDSTIAGVEEPLSEPTGEIAKGETTKKETAKENAAQEEPPKVQCIPISSFVNVKHEGSLETSGDNLPTVVMKLEKPVPENHVPVALHIVEGEIDWENSFEVEVVDERAVFCGHDLFTKRAIVAMTKNLWKVAKKKLKKQGGRLLDKTKKGGKKVADKGSWMFGGKFAKRKSSYLNPMSPKKNTSLKLDLCDCTRPVFLDVNISSSLKPVMHSDDENWQYTFDHSKPGIAVEGICVNEKCAYYQGLIASPCGMGVDMDPTSLMPVCRQEGCDTVHSVFFWDVFGSCKYQFVFKKVGTDSYECNPKNEFKEVQFGAYEQHGAIPDTPAEEDEIPHMKDMYEYVKITSIPTWDRTPPMLEKEVNLMMDKFTAEMGVPEEGAQLLLEDLRGRGVNTLEGCAEIRDEDLRLLPGYHEFNFITKWRDVFPSTAEEGVNVHIAGDLHGALAINGGKAQVIT